jgi:hypothetical protein
VSVTRPQDEARTRTLRFLAHPQLWPRWPLLPLVRRRPGQEMELGVLFDTLHCLDLPGYSATVFLTNVFELPAKLDAFLALPHETYDTHEEVADAGWTVD